MSKKNNYRYVAYDAANGEYEEFETLKEAEDWLKEGDGEGISDEACCGHNYIAEIQYRSVVTKTDENQIIMYIQMNARKIAMKKSGRTMMISTG